MRSVVWPCVAVLAAGLLWWAQSETAAPPAPPAPGAAPADAGARATAAAGAAPREAAAAAGLAPPVRSAHAVTVTGRCLAQEDDAPLAATIHVGADDGEANGEVGALPTQALASATAGSDGRFAFAVPVAAATDLRLLVVAPTRAPIGQRRAAVAPDTTWDLGDVRLPGAARVHGEVVDDTGTRVEGAAIALLRLAADEPPVASDDAHHAISDAGGRFAMPHAVAAGEWFLNIDRTGALRDPRKVQVPASGEHFVRIEVTRPDPAQAIHGRVVDATGAPLADVEIAAYGEGARGRAESGADGAFVVQRGPPHFDRGAAGVELQVRADAHETLRPLPSDRVQWGQRDVQVVMQPLVTLRVRAVDGRGAAVWPFEAWCGRLGATDAWIDYAPRKQRRASDHVELTLLQRGPHVLLLRAADAAFALTGPVRCSVGEHPDAELVVRLADRLDARFDLVDGDDRPVAGCELDLVASLGAAPTPLPPGQPVTRIAGERPAALRGKRHVSLASARSGDDGRATLACAAGSYTLRVRSASHLPLEREVALAAGQDPLRIVLAAACVVRGQLAPTDALGAFGVANARADRRAYVTARPADAPGTSRVPTSEAARAEVAADGAFVLGPLGSGTWSLRLHAWLPDNRVHGSAMQYALGEVDARDGRVVHREYDVAAMLPATVTGVVTFDGQPVRRGQFFLRRVQPAPLQSVRVATDDDGHFRTTAPPGELSPQLALPSQPGPGHVVLPQAERWTVAPGGTLDVRIAGTNRRLQLRLCDANGAPLGQRRLRIEGPEGYERPGALATDADGCVDVDLAPAGAFTLHARDADGQERHAARIDADVAAAGARIEVRVSARR